MKDDSTHIFHTNTKKPHIMTPSDLWGKELQVQQLGKESLTLFLNPYKVSLSHTFWPFGTWGRNGVLGQLLITSWWKMINQLLNCAEIWSPPALVHPLVLPSPSSACTGLPQLCLASWLWGQKHSDGDSMRKQQESVLLRIRGKKNTAVERRTK